MANPLLGLMFHWLGGLSSASFYVPYKGVRRWSWEIFWLTGGVFSWLIARRFFAAVQTHGRGVGKVVRGPQVFWRERLNMPLGTPARQGWVTAAAGAA